MRVDDTFIIIVDNRRINRASVSSLTFHIIRKAKVCNTEVSTSLFIFIS